MSVFNFKELDKSNIEYNPFSENESSGDKSDDERNDKSDNDDDNMEIDSPESYVIVPPHSPLKLRLKKNDGVAASGSGTRLKNREKEMDFEQLDFEFMVGDKSNSLLLSTKCDHHLYTKNGTCVHGIRYRCRHRNCRAFLVYDKVKKTCFRLSSSPRHTHTKNAVETEYFNLVAKNEMRTLCADLATLAGGKRLTSVDAIFTTVINK